MPFLQPLMLFGLAALAIPIIIHLLNRRRYEVVDWGAMRFLQMSKVTRRRLFLEELILMLLRMAVLALLVVALARLLWGADWLSWMAPHKSRTVVLIFDGSSSMNFTGDGTTPQDAAQEWAAEYMKGLAPGDSVAVLQARQQTVPVLPAPNRDFKGEVADAIHKMARPGGGADIPRAIQEARTILAESRSGERDIIVLTDGQRFGWSDAGAQQAWKNLAGQLPPDKAGGDAGPRLWVVDVDPKRDPDPPNWALDRLRVDFPVIPVNSEVSMTTSVRLYGSATYAPKPGDNMTLEVDGQFAMNVPFPEAAGAGERQVKVTIPPYRFSTPGTHLVTLSMTPDDKQDTLPDDNRTDYVVEVTPPMPILYVDGNPDPAQLTSQTRRQTLLGALDLEKDETPALQVTAKSITQFEPNDLLGGPAGARPRVLILCDVASLTDDQQQAVQAFLEDGGGVLATLGPRADKEAYNRMYGGGLGWLPAALAGVEGDVAETKDDAKARIAVAELPHAIMNRYRKQTAGGLTAAFFPKWWRVELSGQNARGVTAADLRTVQQTNPFPFLVERQFKAGRVLLCTVPLDNVWGTNLPQLADFVPLVHDLVYYAAGARATDFNLRPGQPIRYRLAGAATPNGFFLEKPVDRQKETGEDQEKKKDRKGKPLVVGPPKPETYAARETPAPHHTLVCDETYEAGVYRLTTPEGVVVTYVAGAAEGEPDLTSPQRKPAPGAPGDAARLPESESDLKPVEDADRIKAAAWATRDPGVHGVAMPDGHTAYYEKHELYKKHASDESLRLNPHGGPNGLEPDEYYAKHPDDPIELLASPDAQQVKDANPAVLRYENDPKKIVTTHKAPDQADASDLWRLLFLAAMIALMCGEVWMTRRMVKNRS